MIAADNDQLRFLMVDVAQKTNMLQIVEVDLVGAKFSKWPIKNSKFKMAKSKNPHYLKPLIK